MTKESLRGIDSRLVFRETFNSESDTINNGGTSTAVDFSEGIGTFNGIDSFITYSSILNNTYSFRIKLNSLDSNPGVAQYIIDFRNNDGSGTGYIYNATNEIFVSSGTVYVDGIATTVVSDNSKEVIITGVTSFFIDDSDITADSSSTTPVAGTTNIVIGDIVGGGAPFDGFIPRTIIYKGLLSDEQVSQFRTSTKMRYGL